MRLDRRRAQESGGQVIIVFALTFGLFLFGLIALVADVATMLGASADTARSAQSAALAGATDVDVNCFLSGEDATGYPCPKAGTVRLTKPGAQGHCQAVGDSTLKPLTTTCVVTGLSISATATVTVALPVPLGGIFAPKVSSTYTAFAQLGTTTPLGLP